MISRLQFNVLAGLSALVLILVLANTFLSYQNRELQQEVAQSQQFVQQTIPLESLYRDIAKALAETAVKGKDQQVLDMLGSQGLNVSVNAPANGAVDANARKSDK